VAQIAKGGAGKTTISTNLAVELQRQKHKVTLCDLDTIQKASRHFFNIRAKSDIPFSFDFHFNPDDRMLEAVFDLEGIKIFDTGGYDSLDTQALISLSDVVLIPVTPNEIEKNALIEFSKKIEQIVKVTSKDTKFIVVPNRVHVIKTKQQVKSFFSGLEDLGYILAPPLYYRLAYENAYEKGLSVVELGASEKATAEVYDLAKFLSEV